MSAWIFPLKSSRGRMRDPIGGSCAKCGKAVFESISTLDDCYNVWLGKCPHCGALNYLNAGMNSLRGYSIIGMDLVLPYDEEVEMNKLPPDTPTRGSCGRVKGAEE